MPSQVIEKTNIHKDRKSLLFALAQANGISATKMLDVIILYFIQHNRDDATQKVRPTESPT